MSNVILTNAERGNVSAPLLNEFVGAFAKPDRATINGRAEYPIRVAGIFC
jgi:hypothetical protein